MNWRLGIAAWIFIAIFTNTGTTSSHEWSRLGMVESIVERHNFYLEESQFRGTRDKVFRDGHFYSHQAPLLAAMVSPVYFVLHKAGLRLSNSAKVSPALILFVWFTNGLAFAATVMLLHRALLAAGTERTLALVAAGILPLGTWLFPYAVVTNNHGISAMLLALACCTLLEAELEGPTESRAIVLGASLGLMTAFEVLPIVSFVPAAAIFLWLQRERWNRTHYMLLALWLLTPLAAHALLNIKITGDIIPAGFHTEMFQFEGTTFTAEELTGSVKHGTVAALLTYAGQALLWGKGYFTLAPVLALGLLCGVCGWWWSRSKATHLSLLLGATASLGAALLTTNNLGGAAVGFRHATYIAPALLLLLLPLFASSTRTARAAAWLTVLVAAASAVVLWGYAVRSPWIDLQMPLPPFVAPFQNPG